MNFTDSWSITKKLGACFLGLAALLLGLGVFAERSITGLGRSQQRIVDQLAKKVELAGELDTAAERMRSTTRARMLAAFSKSAEDREHAQAEFQSASKDFGDSLAAARKLIDGDDEQRVAATLQANLDESTAAFSDIARLCDRGDVAAAEQLSRTRALASAIEADRMTDQFRREQIADLASGEHTAMTTVRRARIVALILTAAGMLIVMAIVVVIRAISRRLNAVAEEMSQHAEQVASAAQQVSSSSQLLAQGATEQAASLEESSSCAEEVRAMARNNSDRSQSAAELVRHSSETIASANHALDEMVAAMAGIDASSQQISKIIKVIEDIAFQTNILALNAAVEAARAGDAGLGFAVVADEVRNLAQRCATAAGDTTRLISESLDRSGQGQETTVQVTHAIRAITEDSEKLKALIEGVSSGSREQTDGVEQISKAVTQMQNVTQQTAASAEQGAAASEELAAQAHSMRESAQTLLAIVRGASTGDNGTASARGAASGIFDWNPRFEIGIDVIDAQHRKLFELARLLHEAMRAGNGKSVLKRLFNDLITYTETHFSEEEHLMQRCGYPDFADHKAKHEMLTAKVRRFAEDFDAGRATLSLDLLNFLRDWLYQHIRKSDAQYVQYVRETKFHQVRM